MFSFLKALFPVVIPSIVSVMPIPVFAVDPERLWLPVSHESLYLGLKNAALSAENLDRCGTVLRGTVDFDQSTPGQPIFRFLCRQPNGKTYNELVDGNSGKTLTTIVELDPESLSEDGQVLTKEQRVSNAIEEKKQAYMDACTSKSEKKIQLFKNATLLEREKTMISFTHKEISEDFIVSGAKGVFRRDFDARDINDQPLSYKVVCVAKDGMGDLPMNISIRVKKRRD